MKLIRLKLENFRQHRDSEIEFRDGMTAIVGANGTGKSTILESITFALYGEQRKTKDTLKFYWSEAKGKVRVSLEFEFDGKKYIVERSTNDASLTLVGETTAVLATGLKEVKAANERLLSLTHDQFTNSFCAEQKGLAFLNFRNNAERQDEVARMLGFDRLKTAAGLAREKARELRIQIDLLTRSLGDEADLKLQQKSSETRLAEVAAAIATAKEELAKTTAALAPAKALREKAELWITLTAEGSALRHRADALKENVKTTQDAFESAEKASAELQRLTPLENEFRGVELQIKECEGAREADRAREAKVLEVQRLTLELAETEEKIASIHAPDIVALDAEVAAATAALEAAQAKVRQGEATWGEQRRDVEKQIGSEKAKLDHAIAALRRSERALVDGICSECGQATGEAYQEVVDQAKLEVEEFEFTYQQVLDRAELLTAKPPAVIAAENEVEAALAALQTRQAIKEEAGKLMARLKVILDQGEDQKSKRAKLTHEIAQTVAQYDCDKHEAQIKRLHELRPEHEAFLRASGAEKSLAQAKERFEKAKVDFEAARARYREIDEQRKALPFEDETEAKHAVIQHTEMDRSKDRLENDLASSGRLEEMARRQFEECSKRLNEYREKESELKESKKQREVCEYTQKELLNLREKLNHGIRPDLEARASENLSLLTNGRYPVLSLNDAFEATVIEDDIPKAVISGGEEDVVALSLRLALSELIQERQGRPMSLFILDEVFGSLDVDRRQSVLEKLASLKGRFQQILVISHIEEINQVADQCLYLTRDPDTRSTQVSDAPVGELAELL